jgi:gliding motility-associated protein GldM
MAGGKETPRQKMIGMMYLVLTALLAMNISKDVLNAFFQINTSLGRTNSGLEEKAKSTISALENSKEGEKAVPFTAKAREVAAKADEMMTHIETLKARVIACSVKGDKDGAAYAEYMIDGKALDIGTPEGRLKVTKPDDNQSNTTLLIGGQPNNPREGEWSARELKTKLMDFASFLKGVNVTNTNGTVVPISDEVIASIESVFQFPDGLDPDGKPELWETNNFYHTPLVAVLATMSKIQTDVMNAKTAVLSDLASKINATDLKFTDVTVAAVPLTSYVLKGDEFKAEVYLAAYNKNSTTKIYPGGEYDGPMPTSVTEGSGASGGGIASGPDGKCIFTVNTGGLPLGTHGFKGQISYMKDGQEKFLNYYIPPITVGAPALVVSPTNMNVFYRGLDNPVEISVPGVDPGALAVSMDGGSITKGADGTWVVRPNESKEASINVTANINGKQTPMPSKKFRIKRIPDPVPSFSGKKPYDSTIPQGDAVVASGVRAEMEGFDFPVTAEIKSFVVTLVTGGQLKEYACTGKLISADASAAIKKMKKGEKIFIEQIFCKMPDGTDRKLAPITLKLL